jgi:hypothetical protein
VQNHYCAFLRALFELGACKIQEIVANPARDTTKALPELWYDYLAEGETPQSLGPNRENFYKDVIKRADTIEVSVRSHVPRTPCSRHNTMQSKSSLLVKSFKEFWAQVSQICHTRGIPLYGFPQPVEGGVQVVLAFDEAHTLTHKPYGTDSLHRTCFHHLGHVLTRLNTQPVFSLFMSTNSQMQEVAPSIHLHSSSRGTLGATLLPPITELLPFDVFAHHIFAKKQEEMSVVTLETATLPDVITRFGRPM